MVQYLRKVVWSVRFRVLASGSTGNVTVIDSGNGMFLLDAGLSCKKVEANLIAAGVDPSAIKGIFVTHEHVDHYRGLGTFSTKYRATVYANTRTLQALKNLKVALDPNLVRVMPTGTSVTFDDFEVKSFAISHDASEPVGYVFRHGNAKLSIATDLGYVSSVVYEELSNSDVIVLEANHDTELLRMGRYPWNIKRRILSDSGHLSNVAAGEALATLNHPGLQRVYLAHLSKEHNMKELAKMTIQQTLEELNVDYQFEIMNTYEDQATEWDEVVPLHDLLVISA